MVDKHVSKFQVLRHENVTTTLQEHFRSGCTKLPPFFCEAPLQVCDLLCFSWTFVATRADGQAAVFLKWIIFISGRRNLTWNPRL
jgi:hypothetical protein